MNNITIKRITPFELPDNLIFSLNYQYKTELGNFIICMDRKTMTLFVNHSIPDEDIKGFIEYIKFPYYYINDDDTGMGEFIEYTYNKYGYELCQMLLDLNRWHRKEEKKEISQKVMEDLQPAIEELRREKEIDETIIWAAAKKGNSIDGSTPENLINHGHEYIFYLGYLVGSGLITKNQQNNINI